MGKKQHSKDQLYITQTEWKHDWGGAKVNATVPYKVLPFDCCAISFRPFEGVPMCTADGIVFDLLNIVPYLKKYRRHPVTGGALAASDLFKLQFHKNGEGKYHCPVLFKIFNQHSHIVAIKTTGNVYSYEAVKELNLKTRNLKDLIDNTPFTREDVVTIQDPSDGSRRELERFSHVTEKLSAKATSGDTIRANDATSRVLAQLPGASKASSSAAGSSSGKAPMGAPPPKKQQAAVAATSATKAAPAPPKPAPRWLQTTGAHSAGFTSTAVTPVTVNEIAALSDEEAARQRYAFLKAKKKKAYAQLHTSHGNLNIELHVDVVPMTCENFITLVDRGYYNGVQFHRLLKNFMVQGGDPTGTGNGGESMWGKPFKDEISSKLKHEGRGVLSMANSGPDSNGSQFFITFKSAVHLDGKHSVFGKVVGGFDTLAKIEKVATDEEDRPTEPVSFLSASVFVNPLEGLDAEMEDAHARASDPAAAKAHDEALKANEDSQAWYNTPTAQPTAYRAGVGKYISQAAYSGSAPQATAAPTPAVDEALAAAEANPPPKKKAKGGGFGDFSGW